MVIKLWTDARSRKNSVQPISCTEKGALKLREKRILNVTLFGSMHVWDLLHLRSWASHLHQYVYVYLCVHVRVRESTVNAIYYITCFGKIFTISLHRTNCCYSYDECAQLIFPRWCQVTRLIFMTRSLFLSPITQGKKIGLWTTTFNMIRLYVLSFISS